MFYLQHLVRTSQNDVSLLSPWKGEDLDSKCDGRTENFFVDSVG